MIDRPGPIDYVTLVSAHELWQLHDLIDLQRAHIRLQEDHARLQRETLDSMHQAAEDTARLVIAVQKQLLLGGFGPEWRRRLADVLAAVPGVSDP